MKQTDTAHIVFPVQMNDVASARPQGAMTTRTHLRYKVAGVALATAFLTSGCSATVAGALSFADMSTGLSLVSMAFTGKGLGEHAMDVVTGKDCRFIEGVFREDREICEERESVATLDDFKGVVAWLSIDEADKPQEPDSGTMLADAGGDADTTGLSASAEIAELTTPSLGIIEPAAGTEGVELVSLHQVASVDPAPVAAVAGKEWSADDLVRAALPRLREMNKGLRVATADQADVAMQEPVQGELPFGEDGPSEDALLGQIAPSAGVPTDRNSDDIAMEQGIEMTMLGTPVAPGAFDLPELKHMAIN